MAFFQMFKWLIWNGVIPLLNVKLENVYNTSSKYCIYILLAEYGLAETYFGSPILHSMQCKIKV